jgi:hypothetical protein
LHNFIFVILLFTGSIALPDNYSSIHDSNITTNENTALGISSYIKNGIDFCFFSHIPKLIDCFVKYGNIFSTIGVIVVILVFIIQKHKEIRERQNEKMKLQSNFNKTFILLLRELEDYHNLFRSEEFLVKDNKEYSFYNIIFNLSGYENLRDSGNLFRLDVDVQRILSDIYHRIKIHNDLLIDRGKRNLDFFNDSRIAQEEEEKEKQWSYYIRGVDQWLHTLESETITLLENAIVLLEKEQKVMNDLK